MPGLVIALHTMGLLEEVGGGRLGARFGLAAAACWRVRDCYVFAGAVLVMAPVHQGLLEEGGGAGQAFWLCVVSTWAVCPRVRGFVLS